MLAAALAPEGMSLPKPKADDKAEDEMDFSVVDRMNEVLMRRLYLRGRDCSCPSARRFAAPLNL